MAAILNSAILDSAILHKTLTQTHSIWLKLLHSHSTWWWQPSWILPSCIQPFCTKKTSLIHTDWTWWWWPSWILPSCIQPFCTKLWLKLIQSDSNSIILTQLHDGSHLEFCQLEIHHLGFSHLSFSSQTHSHLPTLIPTICTKKNLHSFILSQLDDGSHLEFGHLGISHLCVSSQTRPHLPRLVPTISKKKNKKLHSLFPQKHFTICSRYFTHSTWLTWWWQPSWILPSWIQPLCTKLWLKLIQSDSNSFILTQLDDGSHLEFCHLAFHYFSQKSFIHSFWLNLMMVAILNSAILHSTILHKTLTQTNSIWLKLIHSLSTWWWQPSWILPCWIQTLQSWIQTLCYLLSDSLKNTLTPIWLWIKLIQSDSNSFLLK